VDIVRTNSTASRKINHVLAVSNSLVIGGQNKKVQKIMTFKESYLKDNYLEPFV
jgi:hypothetical protein